LVHIRVPTRVPDFFKLIWINIVNKAHTASPVQIWISQPGLLLESILSPIPSYWLL